MIPELGQLALCLALAVALVQAIVPLVNPATGGLARSAAQAQAMLVAFAFGCLTWSFVTNDFSVSYVAMNSNSALPLQYRVAGVWGGHEGSFLLWCLILCVWMVAVSLFSAHLPEDMAARVLGVMGMLSAGFIAFMLFASNPFERLFPAPPDGRDLNPLLQDPGMVIHPPMLYMGYVGFSVAFAFAVAALLSGRLDAAWARWSRPWTTVAWCFLTLGIALGSGWAYYELGWGGWWFWDPVENASFMPWLVGTALIHSLAVTEKRGAFRSWTVLLAIVAFALSLLGTFLVRSGVLTSVHAFAVDPKRGIFILMLFTVFIGGALILYAWRTARIGLGGAFEPVSRESLLLANNVLLAAAAGTVFLGTLYPLVIDALGAGKISVGPPYFEAVFVPLMAPALFLMGVGPLARWKRSSLPELAVLLRWALGISLVLGFLSPFLFGDWSALVGFGLALALWIVLSAGITLRKTLKQTRSHYGMVTAHIGVAVFVVGVTLVKGYESADDVRLRPGESATLAGHVFRLDEVSTVRGPNYVAARAQVSVTRGGRALTTLYPERRIYTVQEQVMTEAAIDPGLTRDLYVSLGDPLAGGAWLIKLQHKPFVDWIWGGCLIMALGGLLAASDRRYRFSVEKENTGSGCSMKKVWLPLAFIALIGMLAAGLRLNPREVPSPLVGKPAPHFELPLLHAPGKTFTQKDMLGKVWVLNVWASWCPPCLVEHPVVTDLSKTVSVIGLNYKDTREDALPWLKRNGDPYQLSVYDAAGRIAIDYGVYGVPETYVIDRKGVIRYKHIGPLTPEVAQRKLQPLVKELTAGG